MTSENLGEFLTGNRIETSPYTIYMQHNISCSALCRVSLVVPAFLPSCLYRPITGRVYVWGEIKSVGNSALDTKHCMWTKRGAPQSVGATVPKQQAQQYSGLNVMFI